MTRRIPILLYHSVSNRGDDAFAVTPEQFVSHVDAITASGRTALTMSEIADGLRGLRPLPERCVGITFDDGFADTVDAVRVLDNEGLRSTVYVTTGFVGSADMISERQLETLAGLRDSVELGAHTVTHPRLDELTLSAAEDEVQASKAALERMIDRPVDSFAYPHGAHDARVRDLVVRSGYRSAAAVKNAMSHAGDDPWAIARWTVRPTTDSDDVDQFLMGRSAPLSWQGERLRTKAYRGVRRARRRLRSMHDASLDGTPTRDHPSGSQRARHIDGRRAFLGRGYDVCRRDRRSSLCKNRSSPRSRPARGDRGREPTGGIGRPRGARCGVRWRRGRPLRRGAHSRPLPRAQRGPRRCDRQHCGLPGRRRDRGRRVAGGAPRCFRYLPRGHVRDGSDRAGGVGHPGPVLAGSVRRLRQGADSPRVPPRCSARRHSTVSVHGRPLRFRSQHGVPTRSVTPTRRVRSAPRCRHASKGCRRPRHLHTPDPRRPNTGL